MPMSVSRLTHWPVSVPRCALKAPRLRSGFPRQRAQTFLERLLIPLIHFILLGYCPLWLMRRSRSPAFGAGCGQLMIARRADYFRAGGHAAIRGSLHDGLTLPRAFRLVGLATDIFDATDIAECRMYGSASQVWAGLLKNAGEGLASPAGVVPWTLILVAGQIGPPILAAVLVARHRFDGPNAIALGVCILAWLLAVAMRVAAAAHFRQPWSSVFLHPLAIALLLIIQWQSVGLRLLRRPMRWRGRAYPPIG